MATANNESVPFYQAIHLKKRFRLGTVKGSVGGGRYMYVSGGASVAAGDFVVLDKSYAMTQLSTSSNGGVIGVAMSANTVTTSFSWVQIGGQCATANIATAASTGKGLCASATAGRATSTAAAGKTLFGAVAVTDAASNVGTVVLADPVFQNQSTL